MKYVNYWQMMLVDNCHFIMQLYILFIQLKGALLGLRQFFETLAIITLKAVFILKILLDFLVMQKDGLIRKIGLISKLMTSQSGKQKIAIRMQPKFSISKYNQTIKSRQLIEYSTRNIFLRKSFTKCSGETIPRLFSKK